MTLTTTSPRSMRFADAILQRSAVVLLKGFVVYQLELVPKNSVDVTSDKTAVRFYPVVSYRGFGYFLCATTAFFAPHLKRVPKRIKKKWLVFRTKTSLNFSHILKK